MKPGSDRRATSSATVAASALLVALVAGCTPSPTPPAPSASATAAAHPETVGAQGCTITTNAATATPDDTRPPEFLSVVAVSTAVAGAAEPTPVIDPWRMASTISWEPARPPRVSDPMIIQDVVDALFASGQLPVSGSAATLTGGFALDSPPFDQPGAYVLYTVGTPVAVEVAATCQGNEHRAVIDAMVHAVTGVIDCDLAPPASAENAVRATGYCEDAAPSLQG